MDEYLQYVIEGLTQQDVAVLKVLDEHKAILRVKAMKNSTVFEKCSMSEASYRKIFERLRAMRFIEIDGSSKEKSLYINSYGRAVLKRIVEDRL